MMQRSRGTRPEGAWCAHTTCLVIQSEDGWYYGRCLVCGKTSPARRTFQAAREALAADPDLNADNKRTSHESCAQNLALAKLPTTA